MENALEYFKSLVDQDRCDVVLCNLEHEIIYMNPAAIKDYVKRGGADLIGRSLLACHNDKSKEMIKRVVDWFAADKDHNIVHTFFNEKQQKDIYMIALRAEDKLAEDLDEGQYVVSEDGHLIGYYEKHEFRNRETMPFYDLW